MTAIAYVRSIIKLVNAEFVTPLSIAVWGWPNAPVDPPSPSAGIFGRLQIETNGHDQVSLATGTTARERVTGQVVIQLFFPAGTGDAPHRTQIETLLTVLRRRDYESVRFRTPRAEIVGDRGVWWQVNVVAPFFFDDLTTAGA